MIHYALHRWPYVRVQRLSTVWCRYLQEVSNRLFSEGLHEFGREPGAPELHAYLAAYLDGRLPDADVAALAEAPASDLDAVVRRLERQFAASPDGVLLLTTPVLCMLCMLRTLGHSLAWIHMDT